MPRGALRTKIGVEIRAPNAEAASVWKELFRSRASLEVCRGGTAFSRLLSAHVFGSGGRGVSLRLRVFCGVGGGLLLRLVYLAREHREEPPWLVPQTVAFSHERPRGRVSGDRALRRRRLWRGRGIGIP